MPVELPVFYATSEGQTRRIAERLVEALRQRGLTSEAIDLTSMARQGDMGRRRVGPGDARGFILAASIHMRKHQAAARAFVWRHVQELNGRPSAFVSVSLSAASQRFADREAVRTIAQQFVDQAGWRPSEVLCVAGRLAYTRYNWLVKLIMRRIAKSEGGSTDTSRDHEYTNWSDVEALAERMARRLGVERQSTRRAG